MENYFDKVYGCWLGKSIGGSLGMPFEGYQCFLDLDFYDPIPDNPVPNDDLDLQLVWLAHMQEKKANLNSNYLGNAWLDHITCNPDEYGVARWNLRRGIQPPLSGLHNNWFTCGMGAAIRSEIWACLFPGKPKISTWYAFQDASVDHAGEGVYAEIFLAAIQSETFVTQDIQKIFQVGLSFLPDSSRLKKAIQYTEELYHQNLSYERAREKIMEKYGSSNFTDCVMNLCFIILGIFYGESNFEKALLCAVNCGQDTDCTAATIGAFLGILKGREGIPEKWSKPIGKNIKVGDYIRNLTTPKELEELTQQTCKLAKELQKQNLPELKVPYQERKIEDFSDDIPWKINGKIIKFNSIHMKLFKKIYTSTNKIDMETMVKIPVDGEILVMVCSDVPFDFYFDHQKIISWSKKEPIIPAFHRIKGGKVIKLNIKKDKVYKLLFHCDDFRKDFQLTVGFADTNMNFLDVIYEM